MCPFLLRLLTFGGSFLFNLYREGGTCSTCQLSLETGAHYGRWAYLSRRRPFLGLLLHFDPCPLAGSRFSLLFRLFCSPLVLPRIGFLSNSETKAQSGFGLGTVKALFR